MKRRTGWLSGLAERKRCRLSCRRDLPTETLFGHPGRAGRPISERHGLDKLSALISDSNSPAGVMPHLMEQPTSKFRCCLVRRALGRQRIGQINTFIVPHKVVL